MIGMAVGVIGLSLDDTYRLTPSEFNSICAAWGQHNEQMQRMSWEQARFIGHCAILPHSKKGLRPQDIVLFDWEKNTETKRAKACTRREFEKMKRRLGITSPPGEKRQQGKEQPRQ
jgi:hypothetical protein